MFKGLINRMEKIFQNIKIESIATALPKEILELNSLKNVYGEKVVEKIIKNTGINSVHVSPKNKTSSDYCVAAAEKLFEENNFNPSEIDGIIFVTETPDYIVPHTSAILQERLKLPNKIITFDINYGCAGYVYGIFQSFLLIATGYCKKILLCVGDTPAKVVNVCDKSLKMVLGDGGSATLIKKFDSDEKFAFNFYAEGDKKDKLIIPAGGFRIPREDGVTNILKFDENDNGRTLENVFMDGIGIMNFVFRNVRRVILETLEILNLPLESINLFALHQANSLIVNHIAKILNVDEKKVPFGASKTGNTTCASIPLMLSEIFSGINQNLKNVVICGFGTGLTCAAGVVDLSETNILKSIQI